MGRLFLTFLSMSLLVGCAHQPTRKGIISQELPLTLDDLSEIHAGEANHEKILEEYRLYTSPKLEAYCNAIAASLAAVSTRPHLPYKVFILDEDEVNIFGGPGGYIYITRGLLNFVESEPELAGILAHEIGHISHYEYANIPQYARMKVVYNALLKGSEFAKGSIGTYGTAANQSLKIMGQVAPRIARRFAIDQEIHADEMAVKYLMDAGYDPRGFQKFLERLSRIDMDEVSRFVLYLNTHPPFPDRRRLLDERIRGIDFTKGKIEFKQDLLSEVRQMTVNASDSIIFEPEMGVRRAVPLEVEEAQHSKQENKFVGGRKKWGWI